MVRRALRNLFDCRPARAARSETGADGLATLVVPRFTNRVLVRLLVPLLKRPDYRLRLDAIGTFVWQQCDGVATVVEIGRRAAARFGGDADAMQHRVGEFVARLAGERFVTLEAGAAVAGSAG